MAPSYSEINSRLLRSAIANLLRAGISFLTALYLARELGPAEYGRFSYIVAIAMAVRQLIDVQASRVLYTFISAENRSKRFIRLFLFWMAFQLILAICLTALFIPQFLFEWIWAEGSLSVVILGLTAVFMQHQFWLVVASILESERKNFLVNSGAAFITACHAAVLFAFSFFEVLWLNLIFTALIFEWLIGAIVLYLVGINKENWSSKKDDKLANVFSEYIHYCAPLIPYAFISFLYTFFDRWLLQQASGFEEQAYYALALQFSAVALIAMAPLIQILWKEYAEAYERQQYEEVSALLAFYSRAACLMVSVVVAVIIPFSSEMLEFTLGSDYLQAVPALIVMLLFPCQQMVNQLLIAFLMAAKKTNLQTNVGYVFMLVSMPFCYLALAPADWTLGGMHGGAVGLAVKIVLMQSFQLMATIYVIKRFTPISIAHPFYFFSTPVIAIIMSVSLFYVLNTLDISVYLSMLFVAFGVPVAIISLCRYAPAVFGVSLDDLFLRRMH